MINAIESRDIYKGAYFICQGYRITSVNHVRGQVSFIFEGDNIIEEDFKYRTGGALINPIQFKETLNYLRDLVFENLRNENKRNHHAQIKHNNRQQRSQQR